MSADGYTQKIRTLFWGANIRSWGWKPQGMQNKPSCSHLHFSLKVLGEQMPSAGMTAPQGKWNLLSWDRWKCPRRTSRNHNIKENSYWGMGWGNFISLTFLSLQAHNTILLPSTMRVSNYCRSPWGETMNLITSTPEEGSTTFSPQTPESCQSNNGSTRNHFVNYTHGSWPALGGSDPQPEQPAYSSKATCCPS